MSTATRATDAWLRPFLKEPVAREATSFGYAPRPGATGYSSPFTSLAVAYRAPALLVGFLLKSVRVRARLLSLPGACR